MMSQHKKAVVHVKLKEGVLDPQGVTIGKALAQMGYDEILSVRTGRIFELELKENTVDPDRKIREICTKLLANPVIEDFEVKVIQ
jgi:phosphoribosylformylglycinamidine synthase